MPKYMSFSLGYDAWSIVHLLGCYFFMTIGCPWWLTVIFAIFWDMVLDYNYAKYRFKLSAKLANIMDGVLDPRGSDFMDIIFGLAGIGLYYFV